MLSLQRNALYRFTRRKKNVETEDLKYPISIGANNDDYLEPAAFINSQGNIFLIALKKDCPTDPDEPMKSISSYIIGVYDQNGNGGPNKYGIDTENKAVADIVPINGGKIVNAIYAKVNGVKILAKAFLSNTMSIQDYNCQHEVNKNYGIENCTSNDKTDYWGQSMYYCKSLGGRMANYAELIKIFNALMNYPNKGWNQYWDPEKYKLDTKLAQEIGFGDFSSSDEFTKAIHFWRGDGQQEGEPRVQYLYLHPEFIGANSTTRNTNKMVWCVAN